MTSRFLHAFPLSWVCLCLSAQDPWVPVVQGLRAERSPESFVLVATDPAFGFRWFGDDPLGVTYSRELRLVRLTKEPAEALTRIQKGPGWALFDPSGERLGEGTGLPRPAEVRELMERAGWRPLRDQLKAHLAQHPDDCQAWLEWTYDVARYAREAKYAGALNEPKLERIREDLLPGLRALTQAPDAAMGWQQPAPSPFPRVIAALRVAGLDQDSQVGDAVKRLGESLPGLIAKDPGKWILWMTLGYLEPESSDQRKKHREILDALPAAPGQPWPPPFLSDWVRNWDQYDPEKMAQEGQVLLDRNLESGLVSRLGRGHIFRMLKAWGALHLEGLIRQHRFDDALAYVDWLRHQAGRQWPELSGSLSKAMAPTEAEQRENLTYPGLCSPELSKMQVITLQQALAGDPLPDLPIPSTIPLRLAMLEEGFDRDEWAQLQHHATFDAWDLSELVWKPLTKAEAELLRRHHDWDEYSRWVLLRGDEVLETGRGLPTAQVLDVALRTQATPRLDALGDFIKQNPDRLDARRERMALLRPRLPNPRLEPIFVKDIEAFDLPIGTLPFKPNPELWAPVARRICVRLSGHLQHWSFNDACWEAYADWSSLDSRSPRPAALLANLEPWPHHFFGLNPGPLPAATSLAVVKALGRSERFAEVDDWMQILWERGLKAWLARWSTLSALAKDATPGGMDFSIQEVQKLMAAWGQSLSRQGKSQRLDALKRELDGLKPGLAGLLSGVAD